jgi:hypothetical protein
MAFTISTIYVFICIFEAADEVIWAKPTPKTVPSILHDSTTSYN